mgnify:FL=1
MRDTKALVVDVDGVVSPLHGTTTWGDDVVAGRLLGPVLVSASLCVRLDALAQVPGGRSWWLTDWDAEMRSSMRPFPGRDWPSIAGPEEGRIRAHERAGKAWDLKPWWKWWALDAWLDDNYDVSTIVWCDDDLGRKLDQGEASEHAEQTRGEFCATRLQERGIRAHLIAPDAERGLTPHELADIERALRR